MKIMRRAEPRKSKELADEDICRHRKESTKAPRWDKERAALCFGASGRDREIRYTYTIELGVKELERLLSVALSNIS